MARCARRWATAVPTRRRPVRSSVLVSSMAGGATRVPRRSRWVRVCPTAMAATSANTARRSVSVALVPWAGCRTGLAERAPRRSPRRCRRAHLRACSAPTATRDVAAKASAPTACGIARQAVRRRSPRRGRCAWAVSNASTAQSSAIARWGSTSVTEEPGARFQRPLREPWRGRCRLFYAALGSTNGERPFSPLKRTWK